MVNQPSDAGPGCPSGFREERVAALLDGAADDELDHHLGECPVCSELYLQHVAVSAALRRVSRSAVAEPSGVRPPGIFRLLTRRVPLAAALLAGVAGVAVAGLVVLVQVTILAPGGGTHGRGSDWERFSNLDLRGAGVPREAAVDGWTSFAIPPDRIGTALAATVSPARRVVVAGFDEDGSLLWTSRGGGQAQAWPELGELESVAVRGLGTIVSRMGDQGAEETLWVLMNRIQVGALYLSDPATGEFVGRYVHTGPLADLGASSATVLTLPAGPGEVRRLVVPGQHLHADGPAICLSVVEADGTLVQHVELPSLGSTSLDGPDLWGIEVDWSSGHENVTLQTSEGVVFRLPVAERRLDVARASVDFGDTVNLVFQAGGRRETFDEFANARGGRSALGVELAGRIRELPRSEPRDWSRR